MLQALSTNIFSAANDEASTASSSSSSGSSSGAAELFPGLESGMWSATPADTTMDSEENNYCYVLHTATTAAGPAMQWAACSGSNGLVRVYDVAHPRGQLPLLATLDQKKVAGDAAITGVTFLSGGTAPGAVLTCSENGRMFLWDVRTPAAPAVKFSAPPVGGMSMSCVCSRLDGKVVAAGVGSSIRLWDVGTRKVIAVYEEAHTDDVTAIRFHPFAPSQLITGSLDGLVCITDTSVPPTPEGDEDEGDTLVSVLSVEHPINTFDFTDQQAKSIGVITCDEEFSIWSLESCSLLKSFPETRTRLSTPTYAAEHLVGCHYDPSIGPVLVSTNTTGAFALHAGAQDLQTIAHAPGSRAAGHIGQLRSYAMSGSVLVTGGEDSRVCTWGPQGATMSVQAGTVAAAAIAPQQQMPTGSGAVRHEKRYKKINKRPYDK